MNASELNKYIGREGRYTLVAPLYFDVKVTDVKTSYGRVRVLVEPISGSGEAWVDLSSVQLYKEEE